MIHRVMFFIYYHVIRNIAKHFMRVSVSNKCVKDIKPSLFFKNKILYSMGKWIPIGEDVPLGRSVYMKGEDIGSGTHIVKFRELTDDDVYVENRVIYLWTHWQDIKP